MLTNYLKVAFRALLRSKLTSFINIAGLSLAIMCSLMIYLFVEDELSYDRYHTKADRIYRVTRDFLSPDGSVSLHLGHVAPPFGPLLQNDFTDFEAVARTLQTRSLITLQEDAREVKAFNEPNTFFAEPALLDIFTIDVREGNGKKALSEPFQVMLSEKTAQRYFGDEPAVGKQLKFGTQYVVEVAGVFKDFPQQSHWHPELLVSFSTLNDSTIYGARRLETNYGNNSFGTYLLAKEPFDAQRIEAQFPAFLDQHMGAMALQNNMPKPSSFTRLYLQKLTDIHLHSHLDSEVEANGNINHVYMISVIGFFIILIACFNFVNLSTARATKRAKEAGMRKVVGALKRQLVGQFLSESVLIACLSLVIALGCAWMALPWMNDFTGKTLSLNLFSNPLLTAGLMAFTFLVGILAGLYPAFVISGFKPVLILKGKTGSAPGKGGLRRVLVAAQFSISIALMIATAIIFQQLEYLNRQELGYDKDQVINLRYFTELGDNYDAFYNQLTGQASIKNVTRSSRIPTGRLLDSQGGAQVQQGDSMVAANVVIKNIRIDHEFFDTYGIPFVTGRNFSKAVPTDDSLGFVLNEAAVKMLGLTPDDILTRDFQYGGVRGRVLGVVKDFHFESLHEEIIPMVFQPAQFYNNLSVKVAGNNMTEALAHIEKVWREFIPHRPFEYSFLSEQYRQLYTAEQRQGQLFIVFAGLAIVIACLGLFGLATFNTLQRVKEIGIRKVLGASTPHILALLSKEIVMLVLVANVIAWPLAWYFMSQWLDGFAYRIDLSIGVFLLAMVAALLLAVVTVSSQTLKAAMTNPSNTLRYE
jgi:putative ABC transport system permease protein